MVSEPASQQAFFGMSALLFAASATVTIVWGTSMSAMGDMQMPGGWTMSMARVRMPGQVVARGCSVVSWHVGCDDGGNDDWSGCRCRWCASDRKGGQARLSYPLDRIGKGAQSISFLAVTELCQNCICFGR